MAAAWLAFGVAVTGLATAIALPLLAARHIPAGISGTQAVAIIAGGGAATALGAALGIGMGAIIRNQVGAIVTVLALATHTIGFPGTAQLLGQRATGLILAAYAAAVLAAGAGLLRHRDITA
jgi:ABC-2 type transport system permease protein